MRPVNLIPVEQRRGAGAGTRTGPFATYLVVGSMIAILAGVTAWVLTNNQITERKAEIVSLERQESVLKARAARLAGYSEFRSVRELRTTTVASLADSRFDWERVLRELALIIPADVWLVEASGTVTSDVQLTEGAEIAARDSVPGPALELVGCAPGQEAVARFVAALNDIDGATRVGVATSQLPEPSANSGPAGGGPVSDSGTSDDDCRTRDFIARFEIVVAFDAVTPGLPSPTPAPGGAPVTASSPAGAAQADPTQSDPNAAQVQPASTAADNFSR
jgi:Tfp pilus assembly protein PilN